MKREFVKAEVQVIKFECQDVLTSATNTPIPDSHESYDVPYLGKTFINSSTGQIANTSFTVKANIGDGLYYIGLFGTYQQKKDAVDKCSNPANIPT